MKIFFPLMLVVIFAGCNQKQASSEGNESETKRVLDHHWEAFIANDLDETMKDYTEGSVLVTPNGTFAGLEQIRNNFVSAFERFPKDSSVFDLSKTVVVKDMGYIIWNSKTPTFTLKYGSDTFIIRDGKIARQTFAGVVE